VFEPRRDAEKRRSQGMISVAGIGGICQGARQGRANPEVDLLEPNPLEVV
jgi:hypothetical protein